MNAMNLVDFLCKLYFIFYFLNLYAWLYDKCISNLLILISLLLLFKITIVYFSNKLFYLKGTLYLISSIYICLFNFRGFILNVSICHFWWKTFCVFSRKSDSRITNVHSSIMNQNPSAPQNHTNLPLASVSAIVNWTLCLCISAIWSIFATFKHFCLFYPQSLLD